VRHLKFSLGLLIALGFFQASLSAQSVLGFGGVNSTYSLGNSTFSSVQYSMMIIIEYNQNLTASQYISPAQLATSYQGSLNTYPNPGDPPEAILLTTANAFVQQYSQFASVTLVATAGSSPSLQAEIEVTATNAQLGADARHGNPKAGSPRAPLKTQP
jgi:hypothetical protein